MTTWNCANCSAARAVGVTVCPQCGDSDFRENGEGTVYGLQLIGETDTELVEMAVDGYGYVPRIPAEVRRDVASGTTEAPDGTEETMPKITKETGASYGPADAPVRQTDDPEVLAVARDRSVVEAQSESARLRQENTRLQRELDDTRIAAGEQFAREREQGDQGEQDGSTESTNGDDERPSKSVSQPPGEGEQVAGWGQDYPRPGGSSRTTAEPPAVEVGWTASRRRSDSPQ